MILWSLLARSLVIILRTQLSRDIGLKSPGELGLSIFGTKVMKEEFMDSRLMFPE
jgi:hypothetical protein